MSAKDHFFSCDWGTSSFRLRLVEWPGSSVRDQIREDAGVKAIQAGLPDGAGADVRAAAFAGFLQERVGTLCARNGVSAAKAWVMISGMASSTVGWRELPYAAVPFPLDGSRVVMRPMAAAEIGAPDGEVWLVSGVRTATDIMRGEECEILGLGSDWAGEAMAAGCVMVLPGTHAKHVRIEGGAMVDFQTYLTGELADILARHSLLKVSVRWPLEGEAPVPGSAGGDAFEAGVREAQSRDLSSALFRVRTRTVLGGVDPAANGWFLSGLLIGAEIRELAMASSGPPIWLAGAPRFSALYERAFRILGAGARLRMVPPATIDTAVVLAHARLRERVLSGAFR